MAFGDGADDAALDRAWSDFCERLKAAGKQAFKDFNATSGIQRVDAFRFLTQNLGQAFDLALETRDPRYPMIHAFCNPTRKLGGDCADFTYQQAWIDGESTYRITGTRGTAKFFNITVQGGRPDGPHVLHEPFGDVPEVNLSATNSALSRTAVSSCTSVVPSAGRTGYRPPRVRASCSSAKASTAGMSVLRGCGSSASA